MCLYFIHIAVLASSMNSSQPDRLLLASLLALMGNLTAIIVSRLV